MAGTKDDWAPITPNTNSGFGAASGSAISPSLVTTFSSASGSTAIAITVASIACSL